MSMIAALGQLGPTTVTRLRRSAAFGRFQVDDASEWDASVLGSSAAPALVGLDSLLALQEAEADAVSDRATRRHAGAMLAELSAMQRALLQGDGAGLSVAVDCLSGLARQGRAALDPGLAAVMRAITLRAAIEAARHAAQQQHPAASG
jgi:hypothetical protein